MSEGPTMTIRPVAIRISDRTHFSRRIALRWTLALSIGPMACQMPSAKVADEPDDAFWVGAISTGDGPNSFLLTPIARRDSAGWSVPWPQPTSHLPLGITVDSAGRVDPDAVMGALPLNMSNPHSPRIAAPHQWLHYGGLGTSPRARAQEPVPLHVTGLAPFTAWCHMLWRLQARASGSDAGELEIFTRDMIRGVTVNRRLDQVLGEADIPGLNQTAAQLGYERRTGRQAGELYRDFSWLALFRFGPTVLGVVYHAGYEGSSYELVELDGENSRLVASFYRGGC